MTASISVQSTMGMTCSFACPSTCCLEPRSDLRALPSAPLLLYSILTGQPVLLSKLLSFCFFVTWSCPWLHRWHLTELCTTCPFSFWS